MLSILHGAMQLTIAAPDELTRVQPVPFKRLCCVAVVARWVLTAGAFVELQNAGAEQWESKAARSLRTGAPVTWQRDNKKCRKLACGGRGGGGEWGRFMV